MGAATAKQDSSSNETTSDSVITFDAMTSQYVPEPTHEAADAAIQTYIKSLDAAAKAAEAERSAAANRKDADASVGIDAYAAKKATQQAAYVAQQQRIADEYVDSLTAKAVQAQ